MRDIDPLYQNHVHTVEQVGGIHADEFEVLNNALHRLECFWTDQILYRPKKTKRPPGTALSRMKRF